ncbi:MAG: hypothetical protein V1846_01510 [Candidatus Komeilibacteria bacterium]
MRKIFFLISLIVTITVVGGWFVVSAQTWTISPSPAPDNTTLSTPSSSSGDQMGYVNPHQAGMPLSLEFSSVKYRLYNIRGDSGNPALTINGKNGVGMSLTGELSYGLWTATYSDSNGHSGLKAVNIGGGPALLATTTVANGLGAKLSGTVVAAKGYILGNSLSNRLSLVPGNDVSTVKLYWGNKLLCDSSNPTCGWVPTGATGDGLGNHQATATLNMDSKRIYNIGSASTDLGSGALMVSANAATSTIEAIADDGYGVFAYSNGTDPDNSAGLYAYSSASAPAVSGASWLGRGMTVSTPLQILADSAVPAVPPAIQFNEGSYDKLSTSAQTASAVTSLYWGDKLVCDGTKANCGWSTLVGNASYWLDNAWGINNPNLGVGKVLLGRTSASYTLDIGHSFLDQDTAPYPLLTTPFTDFKTAPNDAVLRGGLLYVVGSASSGTTRGELRIIDVSNPAKPKTVSWTSLGGTVQGWGIALSGSYVYIATRNGSNADLTIYDISKPTAPTLVSNSFSTGSSPTDDFPTDVVVRGRYAYLVSNNALAVIDIANPSSPQLVTNVGTMSQPRQLILQGNNLIVVDKNRVNGLIFYNIGNPSLPSLNGKWQPPSGEYVSTAAVVGDKVYAAGTRLYIVNLGTRSSAGSSSQTFNSTMVPSSLVAYDGYAFVGAQLDYVWGGDPFTANVIMFDVANPAAPNIINIDAIDPFYQGVVTDPVPITSALVVNGTNFYVFDRRIYPYNLRTFSFQGMRLPSVSLTDAVFDQLSTALSLQAHSLTANSLQIGLTAQISGTITTGNQGVVLGGTVLDQTTLNGLRTKAGL